MLYLNEASFESVEVPFEPMLLFIYCFTLLHSLAHSSGSTVGIIISFSPSSSGINAGSIFGLFMNVIFDPDGIAVLEVGAPRQLGAIDELVVDVDSIIDFFALFVFLLFLVVYNRLLESEILLY